MKKGFTTGTCAQAAAKAAASMLATGKRLEKIKIQTPSGANLKLPLIDQKIGKGFARCGVIKDSGDDPDVTCGIKIYVRVKYSKTPGISLTADKGVGIVTKPGLAVSVGEYAINPVPRKMILRELEPYLKDPSALRPQDDSLPGLEVVISVPQGEELAKKTFNPRLGIKGGISIIGTTGIVEPKSTEAYKASLSLQLDVLKASGYKRATLVLGYVGENFCRKRLKLTQDQIIKIGDHVGFMLKECAKKGLNEILLVGHIGKMVKVANGQFDTNIKFGDARIETIARFAKSSLAEKKVVNAILKQATAESAIEILKKNGLDEVFDKINQSAVKQIKKIIPERVKISCILLSLEGEPLSMYPRLSLPNFPDSRDILVPVSLSGTGKSRLSESCGV